MDSKKIARRKNIGCFIQFCNGLLVAISKGKILFKTSRGREEKKYNIL